MLTCGCAFLAAMSLFAQTSQEMAAYFTQRIEHPSTFVPAQGASLSPEGLDAARANVWAAWQEANARVDEAGRLLDEFLTVRARGEVMVALHNHGSAARRVEAGDRIAQLVIAPYYTAQFRETDALSETVRGEGGFGSTGKN